MQVEAARPRILLTAVLVLGNMAVAAALARQVVRVVVRTARSVEEPPGRFPGQTPRRAARVAVADIGITAMAAGEWWVEAPMTTTDLVRPISGRQLHKKVVGEPALEVAVRSVAAVATAAVAEVVTPLEQVALG